MSNTKHKPYATRANDLRPEIDAAVRTFNALLNKNGSTSGVGLYSVAAAYSIAHEEAKAQLDHIQPGVQNLMAAEIVCLAAAELLSSPETCLRTDALGGLDSIVSNARKMLII